MRFVWLLSLGCGISLAQATSVATVPFVGCPSGGQLGPLATPIGKAPLLRINRASAERLAYYESSGVGVLAPRGWHCAGAIGSAGAGLFVTADPVSAKDIVASHHFSGPVVAVSCESAEAFGRFTVAEVIARVFPAFKRFPKQVGRDPVSGEEFTEYRPFAGDTLSYKSDRTVEFRTPPQTDGLGTHFTSLTTNDRAVDGVAMLLGSNPDLVLLSVRLPPRLQTLAPVIIRQIETKPPQF